LKTILKLENNSKGEEKQQSWKTTVSWRTAVNLENNSNAGEH
jgi:hypothetical protein